MFSRIVTVSRFLVGRLRRFAWNITCNTSMRFYDGVGSKTPIDLICLHQRSDRINKLDLYPAGDELIPVQPMTAVDPAINYPALLAAESQLNF